jgi:factor associated with neutral sphingomyelinase activation
MLRQLALAAEDALVFDSSRLVDFREGAAWEGPVAQVTPLSREPGRLAVTGARLYFQPLHNVTGVGAVLGGDAPRCTSM